MSASSRNLGISDFKFKIPKRSKTKVQRSKFALLVNKFYGQAKGLISSGQLSTLLHLHTHPINLVVYQESRCQD
jgi:hypothetical protein